MLRGELQGMKEVLKNEAVNRLSTLVEVVDQMESIPSVLGNMEHDEFMCLECGGIFKNEGYKVTLMEFSSCILGKLR